MVLDFMTILLSGTAVMVIPLVIYWFRPVKRVDLLRPRDRRGKTLSVSRETDLGIECRRSKGFIYRFIKAGPAWVFNQGGKMVTKFFGVEGTAYTGVVQGDDVVRTPVSEYLKFLWGDKFYDAIPNQQKQAVETDVVGITVEIGKVVEEDYDLTTLTAADLDDEGDSVVLGKIAKGQAVSKKGQTFNFIIAFLLGTALTYFLMTSGVV